MANSDPNEPTRFKLDVIVAKDKYERRPAPIIKNILRKMENPSVKLAQL
jgi:hypothetical protein